jgi:katanin p60 ATPase-containing subunit A1
MKFDKKPKLTRKAVDGEDVGKFKQKAVGAGANAAKVASSKEKKTDSKTTTNTTSNSDYNINNKSSNSSSFNEDSNQEIIGVTGVSLGITKYLISYMRLIKIYCTIIGGSSLNSYQTDKKSENENHDKQEFRLLKPPPQFGINSEMKHLYSIISSEIYQESPDVRFDDIIELNEAKRLLLEAVQLPIKFPAIFTGSLLYIF